MPITITDPALLAQFTQAGGAVEVADPAGRVIGTFFLDGYGKLPPGVKSPVSDEEFEQARKEPDAGTGLDEVFRRMERDGRWRSSTNSPPPGSRPRTATP